MKALVICPDRPAASPLFTRNGPLALLPALGPSLLQHTLQALAEAGARHVTVLASDRAEQIRAAIGRGERWGLQIEVVAEERELPPEEARRKYPAAGDEVRVAAKHPDAPAWAEEFGAKGWLESLQGALPQAHRHRVGVREISPGVWVGLRTQIEAGVQLRAPCWLGEDVRVRTGAIVGPGALVEDLVLIDHEAEVAESWIGPHTYVGAMTHVNRSLAWGHRLLNADTGSLVEVPDAFLLCDLHERRGVKGPSALSARLTGLFDKLMVAPAARLRRAWRQRLPSKP